MKTAVLASGGVDSSVALRILKDQGHDLTAFYLKIWLQDEFSFLGDCPWEEDMENVQQVCKDAGIKLEILSFQNEYWEHVVSYTIAEIKEGRTPNPDIFCNSLIKFGKFLDAVDNNFDFVATGHYAQTKVENGITHLLQSPDPVKDQTYFLSLLKQEQVKRAIFPIGGFHKKEVRSIADKYSLYNKNRKDSQGICFLGQIKFRDFVHYHLGDLPGDLVELETNKKMGKHNGYYYYTIGQRQGIGLNAGPWYVVQKDIVNNIIYISTNPEMAERKEFKQFKVANINWISGIPTQKRDLRVKIRHGARSYACTLDRTSDKEGLVTLELADRGIATGQFAVFYDEGYCLGGAVICD